MIKYKTVKSEVRPLSEHQLEVLGREGWVLGGIAQRTEPIPFPTPVLRPQDAYYYHFWRRVPQMCKEHADQEATRCADCRSGHGRCDKHFV
jgi:hypothetical protein